MYSWSLINLKSIAWKFVCFRFVVKMLQRFKKTKPENQKSQNCVLLLKTAILCVDTMSFCSFLKDIITSFLNQTHVFLKFDQFAVYWYADHSNPSSGYKVKVVWITQPLKPKVSNLYELVIHACFLSIAPYLLYP